MRYFILMTIGLLFGPGIPESSLNSDSKNADFILRVESLDPGTPSVRFTSAYAFGDDATQPVLTFNERETPFELNFSGDRFIGLFQDVSGNGRIKVALTRFEDGIQTAHVEGQSVLNVLHAYYGEVGFGWPRSSLKASK